MVFICIVSDVIATTVYKNYRVIQHYIYVFTIDDYVPGFYFEKVISYFIGREKRTVMSNTGGFVHHMFY